MDRLNVQGLGRIQSFIGLIWVCQDLPFENLLMPEWYLTQMKCSLIPSPPMTQFKYKANEKAEPEMDPEIALIK